MQEYESMAGQFPRNQTFAGAGHATGSASGYALKRAFGGGGKSENSRDGRERSRGSMSVMAMLRQLIAGAIPPLDCEHRTGSSRDRLLVSFDTPHHIHDDIRVSIGSCHCGA